MYTRNLMRMVIVIASLGALLGVAAGQQNQNQNQNQNQAQPNQNQNQAQPNQNPNQPQNQQAQPQQKKSFWQKVRDVTQQGQNATQQGTNTVQQSGQQVQNGMQQVQNGAQQSVQQGMQTVQPQNGTAGLQQNQGNGAFSGGGGGAGACGPTCFDAGPFQANVAQTTMSQEGGWHVVRMNIQFHNSTNQPLIIAYHDGSMVMIDNNGNTYVPAGGNPGELQGMGIDRGTQTDSQFVLAPGQTGNALFSVARGRAPTSPVGTGYTYNLTIDELQAQNGAMAIPVRTYNLNFPSIVPGTSNAAFTSGASPAGAVAAGGNAPQGKAPSVAGQRNVGAAPQQRMVNGRPAATPPVQTTTAPIVKTAAMKTPVPATKPQPAAAVRQPPVAAAVRQTPAATTTTKPTPAKKTPAAATTTTTTTK